MLSRFVLHWGASSWAEHSSQLWRWTWPWLWSKTLQEKKAASWLHRLYVPETLLLAEYLESTKKIVSIWSFSLGFAMWVCRLLFYIFTQVLSDLPTVYDFDLGLAGLWDIVEQDLVIFFMNLDFTLLQKVWSWVVTKQQDTAALAELTAYLFCSALNTTCPWLSLWHL